MNAERYVKLMTEKVLPAIAAKYRALGVKKVIVQHDGAPPHVGKGAESEIDKGVFVTSACMGRRRHRERLTK